MVGDEGVRPGGARARNAAVGGVPGILLGFGLGGILGAVFGLGMVGSAPTPRPKERELDDGDEDEVGGEDEDA